jgi:hypothetical protein
MKRYSRKRGRKSDYGVAGALLSLFILLPILSIINPPKKKRYKSKKKLMTLDESIDKHFDK